MSGPSSRVLLLLSLLQAHRDWPGDELAGRLEVSPRTVRRDVDRLRDLGYRVEALRGPAGGYRLAAGSDLPPLLFDDDQAVAIALALAVAPASGAAIADSAARALATVRQVMPARLRHRMDAVGAVTTTGTVRVDPEVLVTVSEATQRRELLRFRYGSDDDGPPRRTHPHAVVARHGRWYLLGWDLDREDWRTYRIDRMDPRSRTGVRFVPREIPGDDPVAFVAARFKGSQRGDVWPCIGSITVTDDVADSIAPYLPEDAVVEESAPGRRRVTLGSWSWAGLAGAVAGFAVDFTVEGPPPLQEAVLALSDRLRAAG